MLQLHEGIRPAPRQQALTRPLLAALAVLIASGCASAPAERPLEYDAATALAHEVIDALGGAERWDSLPGIRWSFASESDGKTRPPRLHAWDKHSGMHRVEGVFRGSEFCFTHDLSTGEGRAWMNGEEIEGDSLQTLLGIARSMWINDTYWFLMPYKLLDPGVHRTLEEPVEVDGRMCDKLALSFDAGIGETPGDRYWVYVDRETRRVLQWEYLLQGREPPPRLYTWEGWEEHDGLWFATIHRREGGAVLTGDIETVAAFDTAVFSEP